MKKSLLILVALIALKTSYAQQESAFRGGEWFKFKMSYSGFLKAGSATLTVKEEKLNGKDVYHVVGKGWTTGMIKWFFKVKDRYESYFDKETIMPYKFIRDSGYCSDFWTVRKVHDIACGTDDVIDANCDSDELQEDDITTCQ